MRKLGAIAGFVLLACTLIAPQAACGPTTRKNTMNKHAQDYVAALRRDENFTPPTTGLIVNGQPDPAALKVLGAELAVGSPEVREKIVELLVDLGRETDAASPKADALRHPGILELLAGAGLAKADLGRAAAMSALRKLVPQTNLAPFGEAFVKTLEAKPSEDAFLLVAKAKPQNAQARVDRLAKLPTWIAVEDARIARAALGATDVEDQFLAIAKDAEAKSDAEGLARALATLSLIGTTRSLKAVAERLRTPLTIHVPGAFWRSVRLNVLEALLYNFPEQAVLYPNNINSESDYTAAERFCTTKLGVTYTHPPPPFMTTRGYPTPAP